MFLKFVCVLLSSVTTFVSSNIKSACDDLSAFIKDESSEIISESAENIDNMNHYVITNGTYLLTSKLTNDYLSYSNKHLSTLVIYRNMIKVLNDYYLFNDVEEFTDKYNSLISLIDDEIENMLKDYCSDNPVMYDFLLNILNYFKLGVK